MKIMKLDPVVKKESAFIAVSSLICAALVCGGFALFGAFDLSVLWGGILGWALAAGNFFLMSLDVQRAVSCEDENQAKLKMRASYTWRMLAMLALVALSLLWDKIHWGPVVAAVFYPRVMIMLRQIWQKFVTKETDAEAASYPAAPALDDEEETEDGFERALGHFATKIPTDYAAKKDEDSDQTGAEERK